MENVDFNMSGIQLKMVFRYICLTYGLRSEEISTLMNEQGAECSKSRAGRLKKFVKEGINTDRGGTKGFDQGACSTHYISQQ